MQNPKIRQDVKRRATLRIISWRLVIFLFLVACGITIATTWLLVTVTSSSTSDEAKIAAVKISAIRTGLSVGAGTGGAMALLLAARKQWLGERSQSHQEEVAESEIMDATERRITDLYGKAVDLLGSEKAAVRIGGIFALERLAQATPDHRQTIVDVVCAYLRMPFSLPSAIDLGSATAYILQGALATDEERQEIQVRLTAQDFLRRHLSNAGKETGEFWEGLRVDLTGATLITLNLSDCEWDRGVFTHARFVGTTRFNTSRSTGATSFRSSQFFGFADFEGSDFASYVRFDEACFEKSCAFDKSSFDLGVRFDRTIFKGNTVFKLANFHGWSTFDGALFSSEAIFTEADFVADVQFMGANFTNGARFGQTNFRGAVVVADSRFSGEARFGSSRFDGRLRLRGVQFDERASFGDCTFRAGVSIRNSIFAGPAAFGNSAWMNGASFRDVTFKEKVTFTGSSNSEKVSFYGTHFDGSVDFHRSREGSFYFSNSSVMDRSRMGSTPHGWVVSSQVSSSGRYEIVLWHPPLQAP